MIENQKLTFDNLLTFPEQVPLTRTVIQHSLSGKGCRIEFTCGNCTNEKEITKQLPGYKCTV